MPPGNLHGLVALLLIPLACATTVGDGADDDPQDDPPPAGRTGSAGRGAGGAMTAGAGAGGTAAGMAGAGPAQPSSAASSPASSPAAGTIVISEIMYHPVLDELDGEPHEFVEIHNRGVAVRSLAGWSLTGGIKFAFSANASIGPGQHLVVARSRARVTALYRVDPALVHGDFEGNLDNGGGRVQLVDAGGGVVDAVKYDDKFPWPLAADALGGGEDWLPPRYLPLDKHRHLGISLERVGLDVPADEIGNWAPSALDGATPGKANGAVGPPRPIVEAHEAVRAPGTGLIRAGDEIRIRVRFSARGQVAAPQVEWFVDELDRIDEPRMMAPLARAPAADAWEAGLPAQRAGALVRYRVVGDTGGGRGPMSPRPSDPPDWHATFVNPEVATTARMYHLFIDPRAWGQMFKNVQPGQVQGGQCLPNPSWNARVPATLVFDGAVHDVQIRYHGGYIHRLEGQTIPAWTAPAPMGGPAPLRALGLKVKFPRWRSFEGRRSIVLNKLNQSCPGTDSYLAAKLETAVGVPSTNVRFVRVHINGGYYHYMMELEDLREELLERHHGPGKEVGDLFKSNGFFNDTGPFGAGDERPLAAFCNHQPLARYRWVYKRRSHDWKDHAVLASLIDRLAAARKQGGPALRSFLEQNFHVDRVLSHLAVINWAGAWDDSMHNHFLYLTEGKWLVTAWDYDQLFGGGAGIDNNALQSATASFYSGEERDPNNKLGWNHVKDAFLKAYRNEFHQRLVQLSSTVLAPQAVLQMVNEGVAAFSMPDWMASPARKACDVNARTEKIRRWAEERHAVLRQRLGAP